MKLLFRCLIVLCCIAAPTAYSGSPKAVDGPIVVYGDSLSAGYGLVPGQGWVNLLVQRLAKEGYGQPVINASVSGETTTGGQHRLGHVLEVHRPAILIIELGANDALRGLPATTVTENLVSMAAAAHSAGATVLFVGAPVPSNYGPEYVHSIEAAYRQAARRSHSTLVESLIAGVELTPENFQADQLHPSAAVQGRMLDNVWTSLKPLLVSHHSARGDRRGG